MANEGREDTGEVLLRDLTEAAPEELDLEEVVEDHTEPAVRAVPVPPPPGARARAPRPPKMPPPARAPSTPTPAPAPAGVTVSSSVVVATGAARAVGRPDTDRPPAALASDVGAAPDVAAAQERLRELCETQLASESDVERKSRLCYALGRLHEARPDRTKAVEHYRATLCHAPDHSGALRGARRCLADLGRHAELPALYDAEVRVTRDPPARARLLFAKARVMETRLRQPGPSLAVYREALALDPANVVILRAVERGHARDQAWQELADIYERLANAVDDASLRAAWTSIRAHLTEVKLGRPADAALLYEAALEGDPHAAASLAHVKRLGAEHGRWPQVVAALRREHQLSRDEDARHAILCAIARVQERHLADVDAAVATLEEALRARPGDRTLLRELVRICGLHGRRAAEAEALERLVERASDPEEVAALSHRIARIVEQQLRQPERARGWYERALASAPTHRAAALALTRLLERDGEWAAVYRVLAARAEAISAPQERADLHHRIGNLLEERLGRPVEAAGQHGRALAMDPDHHEAFAALARLYTAASRWHDLVELYERAIERAPHDAEAIAWLFRLGAVLEDRLEDPSTALGAYDRILHRDPTDLGALHALQRAAERAGRYERVVDALRTEADLTDDAGRKDALQHRAATLVTQRLGDAPAAARALEAILARNPTHRPSLESLARLRADAGQWEALVSLYGRLLPLTDERHEKVRLHQRIAEIHEGQLGRDADAIGAYRSALDLDPSQDATRDDLIDALERTLDWPALAAALEERLGRLGSLDDRARAATELGALYEERLSDVPRALTSYEAALEARPLHRPALDARERLLTAAADPARLASALSEEAGATDDGFLRTQAALRAALVQTEQGGRPLEAFRPVFENRPDHVGALLAVEGIYARSADPAGLAATYERLAAAVQDQSAQLAALFDLARAREANGADAADVYRRILALSPHDPDALDALARAAEMAGDRDAERSMHERLAAIALDASVGAHHQCRVGELWLAAGEPHAALGAFRAALALEPRSLTVARSLTLAARAAEDPAAMQQAARHEHQVTRDRDVAVRVLLEAARLHFDADREDAAAAVYEEALGMDPDSPEAATGLMATMMRSELVPRLVERLMQAAHTATDDGRRCVLHLSIAQLHADLRQDLAAAVASTRRALSVRSAYATAHDQLATYLERNGQWSEAADALTQSLAHLDGSPALRAHLRIARIAEHHLDDAERAKSSLRVVLDRDSDHAEALTSLVRLERLSGHDDEALRLARKLFEVVEDEVQKAAALAEMAELEKARGDLAAAASASHDALAVQGPLGSAARLYRGLIEAAPAYASWETYGEGLVTYLERAKRERGDLAATYRELARVFGDVHGRPERLLTVLREGVEVCPFDPSISLAYAKALREANADRQAIEELRRFLGIDVQDAGVWRALAEVVRPRPDDYAVVLSPLVVLGQATAEEERVVRGRRPSAGDAPPGILAHSGLEQLADVNALEDGASIFVPALAEIITKLEGIDHERWGVSKRERIRAGEPNALRAVADRIGRIFGVPEFDLFIAHGATINRAYILSGSPPALLVPRSLEQASEAALAFHLARPLALLSRQLHPLDHVDDLALEKILVGAVRQFEPGFRIDPIIEEEELEAETRRVAKAVGFFSKGRLQEASAMFANDPTPHVAGWAREIRRLAARAALLIADDLVTVLETIGEELGPDNYATDLARFWISDPAFRFRRARAQRHG